MYPVLLDRGPSPHISDNKPYHTLHIWSIPPPETPPSRLSTLAHFPAYFGIFPPLNIFEGKRAPKVCFEGMILSKKYYCLFVDICSARFLFIWGALLKEQWQDERDNPKEEKNGFMDKLHRRQ
jgi:hypothetical protein